MINPEYHKGAACTVKPILCQEGYCSECSVYQNQFSHLMAASRKVLDLGRIDFKSRTGQLSGVRG
jgi:hypothetical protein